MIDLVSRPWGELEWVLRRFAVSDWDLLGCLAAEQRCAGLGQNLNGSGRIVNALYIDVVDALRPDEAAIADGLKAENKVTLDGIHSTPTYERFPLEAPLGSYLKVVDEFLSKSTGNILLDISCFPKRYFFPIMKRMLRHDGLQNLAITYTKALRYGPGELSGNFADWAHLPGFISEDFPEPTPALAIAGVGFMPMSLPALLTGKYGTAQVRLLFPFPPGPPNYQRNWDFVARIHGTYRLAPSSILRTHALNMPAAYRDLIRLTNNGQEPCVLAPYGPKPISAAMAVFAINYGVPVYYTQPSYYSPFYSVGVKETYAYSLVRDGKKLFEGPAKSGAV